MTPGEKNIQYNKTNNTQLRGWQSKLLPHESSRGNNLLYHPLSYKCMCYLYNIIIDYAMSFILSQTCTIFSKSFNLMEHIEGCVRSVLLFKYYTSLLLHYLHIEGTLVCWSSLIRVIYDNISLFRVSFNISYV